MTNYEKLKNLENFINLYNKINTTNLISEIKNKLNIVLTSVESINKKINSNEINELMNNLKNNNK